MYTNGYPNKLNPHIYSSMKELSFVDTSIPVDLDTYTGPNNPLASFGFSEIHYRTEDIILQTKRPMNFWDDTGYEGPY